MWSIIKKDKSKTKKKPQKRGAKQAQSLIRRRRISNFLRATSLAVVGISFIASIYVWKSGLLQEWVAETKDSIDREIADAGFMINEVRISGQEYTDIKHIRAALDLYDGQSIVSLNLSNMLQRVETLPWVKSATIVRIMPDILEVSITEHKAAAIWQQNEVLYLVDSLGEVIVDKGVKDFIELPHIVGEGANENLPSLLALKEKNAELFSNIKSSIWIGNRRWDLNCHSGIKIKLPEKGADLAWEQLHDYESKQKILSKDILIVDMRQHGKTILRLTKQEAERRKLMKKNSKKEESI